MGMSGKLGPPPGHLDELVHDRPSSEFSPRKASSGVPSGEEVYRGKLQAKFLSLSSHEARGTGLHLSFLTCTVGMRTKEPTPEGGSNDA